MSQQWMNCLLMRELNHTCFKELKKVWQVIVPPLTKETIASLSSIPWKLVKVIESRTASWLTQQCLQILKPQWIQQKRKQSTRWIKFTRIKITRQPQSKKLRQDNWEKIQFNTICMEAKMISYLMGEHHKVFKCQNEA